MRDFISLPAAILLWVGVFALLDLTSIVWRLIVMTFVLALAVHMLFVFTTFAAKTIMHRLREVYLVSVETVHVLLYSSNGGQHDSTNNTRRIP